MITVLVVNDILGLAVLVFLIYRQLSVRPVNASALRLIAVLRGPRAISLGFQRVLVMQRAHRLQLAGHAAVTEPGGTG